MAREYNGLISYGELAEEVQERAQIRTRQLKHYWVGAVLGVVSLDCHSRGEPLLPSLCVQQDGHIGAGYGASITDTYGGPVPEDLDMAAAEERLKCYAHFGATLPADGGTPTLSPQVATRRRVARAQGPRRHPQAGLSHLSLAAALDRPVRQLRLIPARPSPLLGHSTLL